LRGFALLPQLSVLAPQPAEFVTFAAAQSILALAGIALGLRHPIADRLRRWFKLFGQFVG
jgi:hypothetical protein